MIHPLHYIPNVIRTRITSKGQTTISSKFRKQWKNSQVFWESGPGGSAIMRPVPGAMSLLGIANNGRRRNPREMEKAYEAVAGDSGEKAAK
jgi:hypothetical protein